MIAEKKNRLHPIIIHKIRRIATWWMFVNWRIPIYVAAVFAIISSKKFRIVLILCSSWFLENGLWSFFSFYHELHLLPCLVPLPPSLVFVVVSRRNNINCSSIVTIEVQTRAAAAKFFQSAKFFQNFFCKTSWCICPIYHSCTCM
jgi:hypothetical protein